MNSSEQGRAIRADVAVLGGGLVGCLTALRLADEGCRVALLERHGLLRGASLHNAGGLYFQLQPQYTSFGPLQRAGIATSTALLRPARTAWDRLLERLPAPGAVRFSGGVIIATNVPDASALRDKHRQEQTWGIDTQWLDAAACRSLLPQLSTEVMAGVHCAAEGYVHTEQLAAAVREALGHSPVDVHVSCGPLRLQPGDPWTVAAPGEVRCEAERVALCLGADLDAVLEPLGASIHLERLPLQIFDLAAPPDTVGLFTRLAGSRLSLKQHRDGNLWVGGGCRALPGSHSHTTVPDPTEVATSLALVQRLIPGVQGSTPTRVRGGWAAWTADGLPAIGSAPGLTGVQLAVGGNGYTLAPLYAELLTAALLDRPPQVALEPFAPARLTSRGHVPLPPDG